MRTRRIPTAALAAAVLCAAALLAGCIPSVRAEVPTSRPADPAAQQGAAADGSAGADGSSSSDDADRSDSQGTAADDPDGRLSDAAAELPVTFPAGWLIASAEGIDAGTRVNVLQLPDLQVDGRRGGSALDAAEQRQLAATWPQAGEGQALLEHDGQVVAVSADLLMVNLPDVLPDAVYDAVYSYASTSRCAGQDIPGVTGQRIPGYAEGRQDDAYLAAPQFAVPCAYHTAVKAAAANRTLEAQGYRLLVFDAYRPMTAQMHLSDSFRAAYESNATIRDSLGEWALNWYVANGPSGHNFGTDLDVGVCDAQGNPLPMPSDFDAFDETGHLVAHPMASGSITPGDYRAEVAGNAACTALHAAFVEAGFSELASEWWHFGDDQTEAANRALAGDGGLDFVAYL